MMILLALILGVVGGKVASMSDGAMDWFVTLSSLLGTGFINLLMMIIAPLIFFSISSGVANIGSGKNLGRIGGKTMLLYLVTTVVAATIGLVLVNIIQPGVGVSIVPADTLASVVDVDSLVGSQKSVGEIILGIIPNNVINAFATNNLLQIIFFAILFGLFLTQIKEELKETMLKFLNSGFEIMMKMTAAIIKLTPIGIFGIIAKQVYNNPDLGNLFSSLGMFILTVFLGIAIHVFIVLPLFTKFLGKVKPFKHMGNMSGALLTAFTTASSSAALPLSMDATENRSGVSAKITGFCLPLGATVNMNGTALFESVAALFVAQTYGIELTILQQIMVVVTALLASIGTAGIPMSGLVMLTMILSAVGLPLEGIGLILAIDFIVDMMRTTANVWGDSCVAVIVAKSEGETLKI